ncbi:LysR family transcriptional regulator ArgP [Specibacter cremeus]|uniref:LysR family transcriptional regulator ArgP n=1 Tax=Specibacter cremeus TaxID=1629051 RepID=UPI00197CB39A|nr:LysR family transcriptional regulator ArgP [Specibacter cremeus]
MMEFQFGHLRTFLAVVEAGTFEAAAARLHVTPSAVSQRIKAMEQAAGQVLVRRTAPIQPTPAGKTVLRLARQVRQLEQDAAVELGTAARPGHPIPVVVNADSLATWFVDALAAVPPELGLTFEVFREDEQHSAALLRSGDVMAAVTATPGAVQGCSVTPLGSMTYRAVAAPAFMTRWFPNGFSARAFAAAPVVQFDRTDTQQSNFFTAVAGTPIGGPQTFIPDTLEFAHAVRAGLGWGLLPDAHCLDDLRAGRLVELVPGRRSEVPLFWQRWKLASPALDALTLAVHATAAAALG